MDVLMIAMFILTVANTVMLSHFLTLSPRSRLKGIETR